MSYNGSGVFNINTAGQPVITGTTISSTTFNSLTADLATGLTTALTKDGQSTPTANIGMGAFKITNLAAGTVASDAARLDQVQGGAATFITVTGTDTLTGTVVPALSAYATGNQFSFLVANTNTGAVTINVDGIGSKAITRTGTTALVAGDMVAGQAVEIIYDGTRFQLVNGNSFTNLKVSGTLGVTGVATFTAQPIVSSMTASLPVFTDASKGLVSNTMTGTGSVAMSASPTFTGTVGAVDVTTTGNTILGNASTDTLNVGNGGLVKDASGNVGIGTANPAVTLDIYKTAAQLRVSDGTVDMRMLPLAASSAGIAGTWSNHAYVLKTNDTERMRIDSSGNVGIGTASPSYRLQVNSATENGAYITDGTRAISLFNSAAAGGAVIGAYTNHPLLITTNNTERMRIDTSGNLLVGTTSAGATPPNSGWYVAPAGYMLLGNTAGSSGFGFVNFGRSGVSVGSITQNGTTAVAYNTTSDYRLKENIKPLSGALARVAALKPCTYTWKSAPDEVGEGFIAHELQAVVPDCVTGEKDAVNAEGNPKYQGIDTSFLVATLTAAIQEQQAIINDLKARIETLESK